MTEYKGKPVKVIIIHGVFVNKNSASFNRNEVVEKMVTNLYPCTILKPSARCYFYKSKFIQKFIAKISFYCQIPKIYIKTRDKNFTYLIFLRSINPVAALLTWIVARTIRAKLAIERNEFPKILLQSKNIFRRWLYKIFILSWHYRLFDIVFLMTDELINFYKLKTRNDTVIQKLPMVVDIDRFIVQSDYKSRPYIFYAGSLSEAKDGVESIIKAFKLVSAKWPELYLKIAGSSKNGIQELKLKTLINQCSIRDRVVLLGSVEREEIPKLMCSAEILVLPRPNSKQARGGFPTKLGEYLASGKPVIVTRVGEIPSYLNDEQVFFISTNNIAEELVGKIIYVLNNYKLAISVGIKGRELAIDRFSISANQNYIKSGIDKAFNCFARRND